MRLIDADAFIEYLGLDAENAREENIGEIVTLEDFDRQPTAYDVDKVVERLEELVSCEESRAAEYDEVGKIDKMHMCDERAAAYRNVIRIVKSGGIE